MHSYLEAVHSVLDWLQSLKQFFINVSHHILVASLTLMALFLLNMNQGIFPDNTYFEHSVIVSESLSNLRVASCELRVGNYTFQACKLQYINLIYLASTKFKNKAIRVRLATSIWCDTLKKNCFKDWSQSNSVLIQGTVTDSPLPEDMHLL